MPNQVYNRLLFRMATWPTSAEPPLIKAEIPFGRPGANSHLRSVKEIEVECSPACHEQKHPEISSAEQGTFQ